MAPTTYPSRFGAKIGTGLGRNLQNYISTAGQVAKSRRKD